MEKKKKAIIVIDTVMKAITGNIIDRSFLQKSFAGIKNRELYNHLLSEWESQEHDFFRYYLNTDDGKQRMMLENLGIEVEADKYPDHNARVMAQLYGKEDEDIFPFQIYILRMFILYCYNHSLEILTKVSPSAWLTVIENNIDPYGNYLNWSAWWCLADQRDKESLIQYINEHK